MTWTSAFSSKFGKLAHPADARVNHDLLEEVSGSLCVLSVALSVGFGMVVKFLLCIFLQ